MHYSPTWSGEVEKKKIFVKKSVDEPKKLITKDKVHYVCGICSLIGVAIGNFCRVKGHSEKEKKKM